MDSAMYFGMGFYWFVPVVVMGLFVWLLVSLLSDGFSNKSSHHKD